MFLTDSIGSSLISGGTSLLGGLLGGSSSKKATKLAINANKEMQANQQAFALNMWNLDNAYNSPSAQFQRLSDAGINPYVAAQQIAPGGATAVSPGSSPSNPTDERGQILSQSFDRTASIFANLALQNSQVEKLNADTTGQNINNNYSEASNALHLQKTLAEIANLNKDSEVKSLAAKFQHVNFDTLSLGLRLDNDLKKAQRGLVDSTMSYYNSLTKSEDYRRANIMPIEVNKLLNDIQVAWYNAKSQRISANAQSTSAAASMISAQSNRQLTLEQVTHQQIINRFAGRLSSASIRKLESETNEYLKRSQTYQYQIGVLQSQEYSNYMNATTSGFKNVMSGALGWIPFSGL